MLSSAVLRAGSRQQLLDVAAAAVQLLGMTWRSDVHEDMQQRLNIAAASLLQELPAVKQPDADQSARQVSHIGRLASCMPPDAPSDCAQR